MEVTGTIETIGKHKTKAGKEFSYLTLQEEKKEKKSWLLDFRGVIEKARVTQGDRITIKTAGQNGRLIDEIAFAQEQKQTDVEDFMKATETGISARKNNEGKEMARTEIIERLALMKVAASALAGEANEQMLSDNAIEAMAHNIGRLADKLEEVV